MAIDPSLVNYFDHLGSVAGNKTAPEHDFMVNAAAQELGTVLRTMRDKVVKGESFSKADIYRWLNEEKQNPQRSQQYGSNNQPLTNATKLLLLSSLSDSFSQLSGMDLDLIKRLPPEMQQALASARPPKAPRPPPPRPPPPQHAGNGPQPYKRKKQPIAATKGPKKPAASRGSGPKSKSNPRTKKLADSKAPPPMVQMPVPPGFMGPPIGTALVTDPVTGQPTLVPLMPPGPPGGYDGSGLAQQHMFPFVQQQQALGSQMPPPPPLGFLQQQQSQNMHQRGALPKLLDGPSELQRFLMAIQVEEETKRGTLLLHEHRERQALDAHHRQAEGPHLEKWRIMHDPYAIVQQSRIVSHEQEEILQDEYHAREELLEQEHHDRIAVWNKMMNAAESALRDMSAIQIQATWKGYSTRQQVMQKKRLRGLQHAWEVEVLETSNRRQVEQQHQIEFALIVELFQERRDLVLLQIAEETERDSIMEESTWRFQRLADLSNDDMYASTVLMFLHEELHTRRALELLEDKMYRQWREEEYQQRIQQQRHMWEQAKEQQSSATTKIQSAWRGYVSRVHFYALIRAKERAVEEMEQEELMDYIIEELCEHEKATRTSIEWEEEETFKDWLAVNNHQYRKAIENFNSRLHAEAEEERDAICTQMDFWEQNEILAMEEDMRAIVEDSEEKHRLNLLHKRETGFLVTQMNVHEQMGILEEEWEYRRSMYEAEDHSWWLLLSEEWNGDISEMTDDVLAQERERRHRADLYRYEAERRQRIYLERWNHFTSLLRVPNEAATTIQCAWRCFIARATVKYRRMWRDYEQQVSAVLMRLHDMEASYRNTLTQEEQWEHNNLVELEEEDWTKVHVKVIERAWCAFKTRQVVNEEVQRHQLGLMTLQQELFYQPPPAVVGGPSSSTQAYATNMYGQPVLPYGYNPFQQPYGHPQDMQRRVSSYYHQQPQQQQGAKQAQFGMQPHIVPIMQQMPVAPGQSGYQQQLQQVPIGQMPHPYPQYFGHGQ